MQRSVTCLVFLLGLAVSFAQVVSFPNEISKATVRPPSGNQLPVGKALTETGLVNERAPPCTLVRYTNLGRTLCAQSGNTSQIDYNMFIVDIVTKSCNDAFIGLNDDAGKAAVALNCDGTPVTRFPGQDILFGFHLWNGTLDTYIGPTFCVDAANAAGLATSTTAVDALRLRTNGVVMPAATRAMRCFYWCTGICARRDTPQPLEFWLKTASNENAEGIFYDLKVTEAIVPIAPLALATTLTVEQSQFWQAIQNNTAFNSRNTFVNHAGFIGPDLFDHYFVDIGPSGTIPGLFWAFSTPDAILRFTVDEVQAVTPVTAARVQSFVAPSFWEISINSGDVASGTWSTGNGWNSGQLPAAVVNAATFCRARTCGVNGAEDCRNSCSIVNFRGLNSFCNLDFNGCSVTTARIFVAVRKPTGTNTISGWDYRIWARFVARTNRCLPSTRLRIPTVNGQVMTGTIAPVRGGQDVPTRDDYFMVNFGQAGYGIQGSATNPYLVLTLYGINHGSATLEVTKGKEYKLGNDNRCPDLARPRLLCKTMPTEAVLTNPLVNSGKIPTQDWCRLVIRNCPSLCGLTCPRSLDLNCADRPPFHQATARDSFRSLLFGPGEDYFATVYAESFALAPTTAGDGLDQNLLSGRIATDYALKFEVFDEVAQDIRNGKTSAGSTWYTETEESIVKYTHITEVGEQLYQHYVITFTAAEASNPELFLEMEIYTNHEEEEVKVYFNPNSLAGEPQVVVDQVGDSAFHNTIGHIVAGNSADSNSVVYNNCYANTISCITSAKTENPINTKAVPTSTNVCYMQWQGCQIRPNIPYYFSVYGLASSEIEHYNMPVHYTVTWAIRTAQIITDRVTTSEMIALTPSYQFPIRQIMYTHQYKLTIPAALVRIVERVRVRFADFKHDNAVDDLSLVGYIQCGNPAGTCPCYTNVFNTATNNINAQWKTWENRRNSWSDLTADACLCTSTTYYVAFSLSQPNTRNNRPAMFTLTPYLDVVEFTSEIVLSVTDRQPNITTGRLVIDTNYSDRHRPMTYLIRNPSTNPNDALEILLRWVHANGEAKSRANVEPAERVMLFINRNSPPRLVNTQTVTENNLNSDRCGVRCVADMQTPGTIVDNANAGTPQHQLFDDCSWCSIVLNECQWSPGDYIVRVWANPTFDLGKAGFTNNARTEPQNIVIDFTLYSRVYNKEPVVLTGNVPRHDLVREYHYNHYTFPVTGVPVNAYIKAEMYLERDQHDEVFMLGTWLSNTTTRAGFPFAPLCNDPREYLDDYRCRNYNFQFLCKTSEPNVAIDSSRSREYCSFYIKPCDIVPGGTMLLSIYAPGSRRRNYILSNPTTGFGSNAVANAWNSQHMWGSYIDYTIQMTVQAPVVLSLANGWPVTGSVFVGERVYYAFTANAADFFGPSTAGSFLTFEVDGIRPQFDLCANNKCLIGGAGKNSRIKTMVISPETPSGPGFPLCPCTNVHYLDEFEHRMFYCDLLPLPKTYYLEVLGLRTGVDAPYDPVTFTVRAYKTDIPFVVVPVVPSTRQHPTDVVNTCSKIPLNTTGTCPLTQSRPINFGEWVAYQIEFPAGAGNEILYVEIMDVRALPTIIQANTLPEFNAYISRGFAGSPPSFFRRGPQSTTTHATYTEFASTNGYVFADRNGPTPTSAKTLLGSPFPSAFGCSLSECIGVAGTTAAFDPLNPTPFCVMQLGGCIAGGSGSFFLTVQSLVSTPYSNCTDPAFTFKVRARSAPIDTTSLTAFVSTRDGVTPTSRAFSSTTVAPATNNKVVSGKTNQIHRYWMVTPSIVVPSGGYFMAWPTANNVNLFLSGNSSVGNNNEALGETSRLRQRTRTCVSECACPNNLGARNGAAPAGSKCYINCGTGIFTSTFFIMLEAQGVADLVAFEVSLEVGYPPTLGTAINQVPNSIFFPTNAFTPDRFTFNAGKVLPYTVTHWQMSPAQLVAAGDAPRVEIEFTGNAAGSTVCFTRGVAPTFISPFCTSCTTVTTSIILEYCDIAAASTNYFISYFNPSNAPVDGVNFGVRLKYIPRAVGGAAPVASGSGSITGGGVFTFTNPQNFGLNGTAGYNEYAFARFSITRNNFAALRWRVTVDSARIVAVGTVTPTFLLMYGTNCLPGTAGTCMASLTGTLGCAGFDNTQGRCYFEFPLCNVRSGDYVIGMFIQSGFQNLLPTAAGAITLTSTAAPPVTTLAVAQSPYSAYIANPSPFGGAGGSFGDVMRSTFYLHYAITVTANDLFQSAGNVGNTGLLRRVVSQRRVQVVLQGVLSPKSLDMFMSTSGLAGTTETSAPLGLATAGTCYTNTGFTCSLETVNVNVPPVENTVVSAGGNTLAGVVDLTLNARRRLVCSADICDTNELRSIFLRARNCFANTGAVDNSISTTFYASITHSANVDGGVVGNPGYIPATNPTAFGISAQIQEIKKPVTSFVAADLANLYVILPTITPGTAVPNVVNTTVVTPFTTSVDGSFAVGKTTLQVSIPAISATEPQTARFAYIPISTAGFVNGDYLLINVTAPDWTNNVAFAGGLKFDLFRADQCEPTGDALLTGTVTNVAPDTHLRGHLLFLQTDPCYWADGLQSGNNLWWLRITNNGNPITQFFGIHVLRMTPTRKTVNLTPALPRLVVPNGNAFEETVVMWEERWMQYQICTPVVNRREHLYVQVQSHCTGLRLWRNWQDFNWASAHCHDFTTPLVANGIYEDSVNTAAAKTNMNTCRYTGGCYYISLKADDNSLANFFPKDARLGGFRAGNPQISFTIKAWLFTAPIEEIPFECSRRLFNLPQNIPAAGNLNPRREITCGAQTQLFYLEADYDNFGTSLNFQLTISGVAQDANLAGRPVVTVVAPWYWRRVGVIGDALMQPSAGLFTRNYVKTLYTTLWLPAANPALATNVVRDCELPSASPIDGVYSFQGANNVWVSSCLYENGRYYVTVDAVPQGPIRGNGQYALSVSYNYKYVPVVALSPENRFLVRWTSNIAFSVTSGAEAANGIADNVNYQYYKVIIDRNTAQVLTFTLDQVRFVDFAPANGKAIASMYITQFNEGRRHPGNSQFGSTASALCFSPTRSSTVDSTGGAGIVTFDLCGVLSNNDPKSLEQYFIGVKATNTITAAGFQNILCTTGTIFVNGLATYRLTASAQVDFTPMVLDRSYCSGVALTSLYDFRWNNVINAFPRFPLTNSARPQRHLYRLDVPLAVQNTTNNLRVEVRSLRAGTFDNARAVIVRIGANRIPNANLAVGATAAAGCYDFPAVGVATVGTSANGYPHRDDHYREVQTTCGKWVSTYWIAVDLAPQTLEDISLFTVNAYVAACTVVSPVCTYTNLLDQNGKIVPVNVPATVTLTSDNFVSAVTPGAIQAFTRVFPYDAFFPPTSAAKAGDWAPTIKVEIAGVAGCGVTLRYGFRPVGSTSCASAVAPATITACSTAALVNTFTISTVNSLFCARGIDGANIELFAVVLRTDPAYTCAANAECRAGSNSILGSCTPNYGCDSATFAYQIRMYLDAPQAGCAALALSPQNDFLKTWTEARLDRNLLPRDSENIFHYWTVPAGSEGFVHASIGLTRGSADTGITINHDRTKFHNVYMKMFRGGCHITSCQTNTALTNCAGGAAGVTSEASMSCYVNDHWRVDRNGVRNFAWADGSAINRNISADALYYLVVSPVESTSYFRNYISYSIRAQNAFTSLTGTASGAITIHGFDRHYFKVAASEGGVPKSVVVRINVNQGPRLIVDAADTEFFVDEYSNGVAAAATLVTTARGQSTPLKVPDSHASIYDSTVAVPVGGYRGWTRRQVAEHGETRIEISTRAMHPHSDWIYIWVTPEQDGTNAPCEKPTIFTISGTTGTANCGAIGATAGFCTTAVSGSATSIGGANFFTTVNATSRQREAECRFDKIVACYCPRPNVACLAALREFACLETFHECDPDGFAVGMCRDQCSRVEEACGPWIPVGGAGTCAGCYPEYSCACNSRYLDGPDTGATTCTGTIRPASLVSPGVPPGSPVIPPTPVITNPLGGGPPGPPGRAGPAGANGGRGPSGPAGPPGGRISDLVVDVRVDLLNSAPSSQGNVLLVICSLFLAFFLML